MNRWHSSELWAVFLSSDQYLEYDFIPTNKTKSFDRIVFEEQSYSPCTQEIFRIVLGFNHTYSS